MKRAADLLVDCLAAHGLDRLFCVPGESYLAFLDALVGHPESETPKIDTVVCRQEGGAGFMALADAKLTGRAGLLAVSRGPGATNASIAIHSAQQDAVPLLVLIGQVARWERGRGAFQEVDYVKTFSDMAKGVWEVENPDRLPEVIARALHTAYAGTPGAAVVVLPEDMLGETTEASIEAPLPVARTAAASDDIERTLALLAKAERPLLIAGGLLDRPEARRALAAAAERHQLPVASTFKHQEIFDNGSPLYAGNLGFKIPHPLVTALSEADLILAVGTRLGDVPTQGYRLPKAPQPDQPLIHVYPDPDVIGRVFRTDLGLACDPASFLTALSRSNAALPEGRSEWVATLGQASGRYRGYEVRQFDDGIDLGAVIKPLAARVPKDAILVTDAGNFSSWINCLWPWDGSQLALGAVGGAMGLGVPGAVAAALRHPDRMVIAVTGDGGLMMTGNELASGIAAGAKPKILVSDNGSYGTIRLHQERDFPHRTLATDLANPDFARWAEAFGARGLTVTRQDEVEAAVTAFLEEPGPVLLSVASSLQGISANTTISKLRGD
ncbi:MAG: thiamine pyrophosphate-binding protein [Kiloniellales bacterium]